MPLVYMNSWASLALRAAALVGFAGAVMAGGSDPPRLALAATALLLAASAAHPLSVALRLRAGLVPAALAVAEGVTALALAALLAQAASSDPSGSAHAAALAVPIATGLAVLAIVAGLAQRDRVQRRYDDRWPAEPVGIALGSAGTALVAALLAESVAHGARGVGTGLAAACAFALAAWITHSALRLRRARRDAIRALQRDRSLARRPIPPRSPSTVRYS